MYEGAHPDPLPLTMWNTPVLWLRQIDGWLELGRVMSEFGMDAYGNTRQNSTTAEQVMLIVLGDSQRPILEHYQKRESTANTVHYSEMLLEKLKPAIQSKCWGLLLEGTLSLRDNAHPLTGAYTIETLWLEQPLNSPDLLLQTITWLAYSKTLSICHEQRSEGNSAAWLISWQKDFFLTA